MQNVKEEIGITSFRTGQRVKLNAHNQLVENIFGIKNFL